MRAVVCVFAGFIQSSLWTEVVTPKRTTYEGRNETHVVVGPNGHSLMLSIVHMDIPTDFRTGTFTCGAAWLGIYKKNLTTSSFSLQWKICNSNRMDPVVVMLNQFAVRFSLDPYTSAKFRLLFTFHKVLSPFTDSFLRSRVCFLSVCFPVSFSVWPVDGWLVNCLFKRLFRSFCLTVYC